MQKPSSETADYGSADHALADALSKASSEAEADQIARDGGFTDAEDARNWLEERSQP